MAYIRKIIGSDEKLLEIARLHWIYLLTGIAWFIGCTLTGWAINWGILKFMTAMAAAFESSSAMLPLVALNNWLMPVAIITGITIFCFYLIKVLTTEIGLTNRRVLHKSGWLFVKTRQIDIEEVRGEFLDLGFWGRFLHYGFLNLDCRFIGDVRLPAIEQPENFVKLLHKVRSEIMDTVTLVAGKGNPVIVRTESEQDQEKDDDIRTPQPAPKPEEQPQALVLPPEPTPPKAGDVVMTEDGRFVAAPGGNPFMVAPTQPNQPTTPGQPDQQPSAPPEIQPPAQPEVSPPPQPQQPMPGPEIQPPTQPTPPPTQPTGAAATVDPATVAQIVEQVMPKMVEKITEEMAAKGMIAQPEVPKHQHDPDGIHVDADLISSFDDAISKRKNGPGLRIVH